MVSVFGSTGMSNEYLCNGHFLKLYDTFCDSSLFQQVTGEHFVKYLGSAVDVIRIFLVTRSQCDVGDVLHRVGQGQQHLALLKRQHWGEGTKDEPLNAG